MAVDATLARMRQMIGTPADWAVSNLVLGNGELAAELQTDGSIKMKMGTGSKAYSLLPYVGVGTNVIRTPVTETLNELPAASARKGFVLGFDATTGQPVMAGPTSGSATDLALQLAAPGGSALVGILQAGTGAVARTQQDRVRDIVYVEDFGGKADWNGTTGTDLAPAWDKAIAALPSAGGVLRMRPGRYYITRQLLVPFPGHYVIEGAGGCEADNNVGGTEIIKAASMTTQAITVRGPFSVLRNFVVRGLTGNAGEGIYIAAHSVKLEHLGIFRMGTEGVRIGEKTGDTPPAAVNCNHWYIGGCVSSYNGRHGYWFGDDTAGSTDVNAGIMINCVGNSNVGSGCFVGAARLNTFVGGDFETNGDCGIRFYGSTCGYNSLFGGDFEGNVAGRQIAIEAGATSIGIYWPAVFDQDMTDNGVRSRIELPMTTGAGALSKGINKMIMGNPAGANDFITGGAGSYIRFIYGGDAISDQNAQILISTLGTFVGKVGGSVGFYGATPVVRSAGWGTPTGPAKLASFPGASATLVQCSAAIAQIITDLKSLGLYGA